MTPKLANAMSVLGISKPPDGSDEYDKALKTAWRTAASKAHPDRGGSADKFKAVTEAHDHLRECQARARGRRKTRPGAAPKGWTSTWGAPPETRTDVDDDVDDVVEGAEGADDDEDIDAIVGAVRDLRIRSVRVSQRVTVAGERTDMLARKLRETNAILERMLRQLGEVVEILEVSRRENESIKADINKLSDLDESNPYSTFTDDQT